MPFNKLTKPPPDCLGGIGLRLVVVLAGAAVGWIWWTSGQSDKLRPMATSPPPAEPSNGVWVVPVSDPTGRRTEPMVLIPVSARPAPSPVPTPVTVPIREPMPVVAPPVASSDSPGRISSLVRTDGPAIPRPPFDDRILAAQVAMAWRGISSGPFDGVMGSQTRAALRVFQTLESLPVSGQLDEDTLAAIELSVPVYTNYFVSEEDLGTLQAMGRTWLARSQQSRLGFETILELVAERTLSNVKLVRWLNPQVDWTRVTAGTELKVIHCGFPVVERKAAFIRIHLADRKLIAYDSETNLLAYFPCSIAARVDKRPLGEELHITAIAPNPNYTFDPAVFPESAEAQQLGRKLILQPGPNNPVGTVWLSLDKPGYGIHGTPKPEEVGRTESHGCFRLANWNAEFLLKLVTVGTLVSVEP
jgi:lipoprotein-anchoring transpeptidase ErfK/SrfK